MNKFEQLAIDLVAPVVALMLPIVVSAQISNAPVPLPSTPYTGTGNVVNLVCGSLGWIFWGLIVLTIVFVLVAAFKYLTASGDPEKVKNAGHTLLYAAIAIVVALIAKGVPLIISSFIGGGLTSVGC
jgi:hypothetical protein